jgi:hypothetical protein
MRYDQVLVYRRGSTTKKNIKVAMESLAPFQGNVTGIEKTGRAGNGEEPTLMSVLTGRGMIIDNSLIPPSST